MTKIIWLVLFSLSAFSQDQAIEEYCFSSVPKMKEVKDKLKFILVPVDKVQENNNCFTVSTSSHRRELIQSYVRRIEPAVSINFSSAEIKRDPCQIKVEKIKNINLENNNAGVTLDNGNLGLNASTANTAGSGKDVTSIQTLKEFELTVNQDVIKGECRMITPNRYEIVLEVRKDPKPLIPASVPPGTVVVIPDAQIPPPQETSRLQTTLQLNRGDRIEIGSVVKNLKNDTKKADVAVGANVDNSDGVHTEKVFLSME